MMKFVVDLRMIKASGIGTYICNLLPLIINNYRSVQFILLGNRADILNYSWANEKNVTVTEFSAPIYSVLEQIQIISKIPRGTSLFWSPHYNIPLLYSGRLIVTVHDVFHLAMPKFVNGIHKRLYAKFMFKAVATKADRVICISNFTKNEFQRYLGVDDTKIKVVYLGIDKDLFNNDRKISNSRPYINPYLLYVGNVKPHKNLISLINAFDSIRTRIPHDLIIVGKKDGFLTQDKTVYKLAEKLGSRVKFTGLVTDNELSQYYSYADLLVFPSLYEGFGLPPLEAMASGCPAIVSDKASLPEICGDAVIYFDPYNVQDIADKIMLVLSNDEIFQNLKKAGEKHTERFSWREGAEGIINVIDEVLSK